ncbi:P-loop ATPase, Sll1717 family [Kiloniella laminariae]|uniref:P-loop ATPase, Sll1717 family n=1 Tax=Kiloniella laminariae TaxID=454162 RepID=UPI000382A70F|nr:hypothetical protein [Kiloniella laminariae]
MPLINAFFAYASTHNEVGSAIRGAQSLVAQQRKDLSIHTWVENDISGRALIDPIFKTINNSEILIADITTMNFNVTFEIGYAIGLGKRVYLVRNANFKGCIEKANKIGIFDTLGFVEYSDQEELADILLRLDNSNPIMINKNSKQNTAVYLLQTPTSGQAMLSITASIKKARLKFKSFIPVEEVRLAATKAIDEVANSLGVVIPLLSESFADYDIHNIRAAFVAGLGISLEKVTLVLQSDEGPAPLDVRDFVKTFRSRDEIADHITELALEVTERLQLQTPIKLPKGNFLSNLSIGDPIAENEFQTLANYFLRTDQFGRASRGEVNLVVGRKGAGKTALFSQLRDEKRAQIQNIVVDLKPEGYQLIRLKEDVLDFLAEGAKTHLITAFFEYILYLEICYKLLEKDKERHVRDQNLYEPYRRMQEVYESGDAGEGDFSERLLSLSQDLAAEFQKKFSKNSDQRLTSTEVTELIHKHNIRDVREVLSNYLKFKKSVWVLFDNLDKGWSMHGISSSDVLILRCLIDAARKIQRQMQSNDHDFHCVVFVRNDVYQLLVEVSADYGKESRAVLDWTEPDLLREMLRRRLVQGQLSEGTEFELVWPQICISHYKGEESSQYLIERSLMRPRNLLKIIGHCRSFAVNLGHERISEDDLEKGLRAFSLDLITEADQELTDIVGAETSLIYYFIGEGNTFTEESLRNIISSADVPNDRVEKIIQFLLYYGFIGIKFDANPAKFIFDVGYDMRLIKVLSDKNRNTLEYILNPAFYPALNY